MKPILDAKSERSDSSAGPRTWIKICGITRLTDAREAVRAGANAIGFIFARSARRVSPSKAEAIISRLHPSAFSVGVFVDASVEQILQVVDTCGLGGVQLHGHEPPAVAEGLKQHKPDLFVMKAFRVRSGRTLGEARDFRCDAILADAWVAGKDGGTGKRIPVRWLTGVDLRKTVVSGGLNPANVSSVLRKLDPWGVDVSSGVEVAPGRKDRVAVRGFIQAVGRADARRNSAVGPK